MKRIWIKDFLKDKEQIKGSQVVTILVPYGEDYLNLKIDMKILGFNHTSTQFVGPGLMDTEQHFRKV